MKSTLLAAARAATDLLFPSRCVHCSSDGSLFCAECEAASTKPAVGRTCRRCALPSNTDTCEVCFNDPPPLDRAIAVFTYGDEVSDAVTALKYRDIRALAPRLGALMAESLAPSLRDSVDALVPVPLSRSRTRSRGYNQAELLAKTIGRSCEIEVRADLLTRTEDGPPQARASSIEERASNVRDAFEARDEAANLRLLLIDDVMTTGSTLNACARSLKKAGATWVGGLVLAREL